MKPISEAYKKLIIKFVLCAVLGLGSSSLLGLEGSPTIAITAVLVTYTDRGKTETLHYCLRRVGTQIVMGAVLIVLIFVFQRAFFMPEFLLGILPAAVGMAVGLVLDDWFHISPMPVTLGCTVLIMSTGIPGNYIFYCRRMGGCVVGVAIAYMVNYLVHKIFHSQANREL